MHRTRTLLSTLALMLVVGASSGPSAATSLPTTVANTAPRAPEFRINPPPPVRFTYKDLGDYVWQRHPAALLDAIRKAEGVPSYGVVKLARRYGGHTRVPSRLGRDAARELVARLYRDWVRKGRPGGFLAYLRNHYAPLGAKNDPRGLNHYWLANVKKYLPKSIVDQARKMGLK